MSLPTGATRSIEIDAARAVVYDVLADITRTGEWSPECRACEWIDGHGRVGSRFRGHNRRGLARWTTTAEVIAADRPTVFAFATLHRGRHSTRWTYTLAGNGTTTLTESFEAVSTPWLIAVAERLLIRNRQQQLEAGIDATLARIKSIAEGARPRVDEDD
jgi:hypothetical protein